MFIETRVPFSIDMPAIQSLYTHGLLKNNPDGYVEFWVPLYRKRLFNAFYPYSNGEGETIKQSLPLDSVIVDNQTFHFDQLIESFKVYIKKRSFRPFREKNKKGKYKSIPEAVMVYSFKTYIHSFLQMINGKSYREAQVSLGNSDLIMSVLGKEYLIETKIYRYDRQFQEGKEQLAYYCKTLNLREGTYLVFVPNNILYPDKAKEGTTTISGIDIHTYLVWYDEEKDF